MISIMSVFLMWIHPFVIAPRPNVGPELEAVGQYRIPGPGFAGSNPQAAHRLHGENLNSLVSVQPPVNAIPSQRFAVRPFGSCSTNVASRGFFTQRAIWSIA